MTPLAVSAEPMVLTPTQMESITAAGPSEININVTLISQTILTTQVAKAIAVTIASCGICVGGAPSASSLAAASNTSASAQQIGR
jgi:hypothetical protein